MEIPGWLIGLLGSFMVAFVNVALFAYGYGKLSQKVVDALRRLDRIEKWRDQVSVIWMRDDHD